MGKEEVPVRKVGTGQEPWSSPSRMYDCISSRVRSLQIGSVSCFSL